MILCNRRTRTQRLCADPFSDRLIQYSVNIPSASLRTSRSHCIFINTTPGLWRRIVCDTQMHEWKGDVFFSSSRALAEYNQQVAIKYHKLYSTSFDIQLGTTHRPTTTTKTHLRSSRRRNIKQTCVFFLLRICSISLPMSLCTSVRDRRVIRRMCNTSLWTPPTSDVCVGYCVDWTNRALKTLSSHFCTLR